MMQIGYLIDVSEGTGVVFGAVEILVENIYVEKEIVDV